MMELAVVEVDGPEARVVGEVDMSNAAALEQDIRLVLDGSDRGIVLDLSGTTYLDSAGLRMIFALARHAGTAGKRLELVVPDASPVHRVLEIAELPAAVPVHATPDPARQALGV